jgi:hypothetical protein
MTRKPVVKKNKPVPPAGAIKPRVTKPRATRMRGVRTGEKVTIYLDEDNLEWLDKQTGPSRSWKISQAVRKMRATTGKTDLDHLLLWLLNQEQQYDTMYVVAMFDAVGATNKGVVSLTNLLRTFLKSEFRGRMNTIEQMAELEGSVEDE